MISVLTLVIFSIFQVNMDTWIKVGIGLGGFLFGILLMTIIHTCKKKKEKKQYVYNILSFIYGHNFSSLFRYIKLETSYIRNI